MARKATTTQEPAPVSDAAEVEPSTVELIKKPQLLDRVVTRTNLKKRDVKPAVEAALAVMREALQDGAELNLPPLGKVRLVKTKELEGGASVMTLKLRTPKHATFANQQTDFADQDT
ncbi:HU family DNA-binding protein [Yoonia sp.]|uniref:HU family DNA-binding protein n=1 Tax=Yoonia sp. TaxID=2212373 RepID=UPI002330E4A2|nr:HU family DNA-binding protein [Yoonia sp.]MDB4240654.1 HU family DNA-binding protein [Yoonia sp.]